MTFPTFVSRIWSLAVMMTAITGSLLAMEPPPLPDPLPAQRYTSALRPPPPLPSLPPHRYTAEELAKLPLSGTSYHGLLAALLHPVAPTSLPDQGDTITDAELFRDRSRPQHGAALPFSEQTSGLHFTIQPNDVPTTNASSSEAPYSTDPNKNMPHQVAEPAFMESRIWYGFPCRCFRFTDYAAFIHYPSPNNLAPVIHLAKQDLEVGTWSVIASQLNPANASDNNPNAPFIKSGDPVLATNPYQSGFNPQRVYLATTTFNDNAYSQITVWYSDDRGNTWNHYPGLEYHAGGYFDDKPAITVSWNPNTLGYVYVAMVVAGGGLNRIRVYRLTPSSPNGQWENLGDIASDVALQSPRLDVNPNQADLNGTVYLSWVDWNNNQVTTKISTNQGVTWPTTTQPFSTGTLLTPISGSLVCASQASNSCVQQNSMLATRFNASSGNIELVYHRRKGTLGVEAVRNTLMGTTWQTPQPLSSNSTNYNWAPAVDCAPDGTCLITFYDYDPIADPSKIGYRLVSRRIYTNPAEDNVTLYNSAAAAYPSDKLTQQGTGAPYYVLGEYQDVWYFNSVYSAATVYNDSTDPAAGGTNMNDIVVAKR